MAKFVLLRIENETEAQWLIDDAATYPESPILTPSQENAVHAQIVSVTNADPPALHAADTEPAVGWYGHDSDDVLWHHRTNGWHFLHCLPDCHESPYRWGKDGGIAYPIREVTV
jgi:hypothetical protein